MLFILPTPPPKKSSLPAGFLEGEVPLSPPPSLPSKPHMHHHLPSKYFLLEKKNNPIRVMHLPSPFFPILFPTHPPIPHPHPSISNTPHPQNPTPTLDLSSSQFFFSPFWVLFQPPPPPLPSTRSISIQTQETRAFLPEAEGFVLPLPPPPAP